MICTAIGYNLGFYMGVIFQVNWIDSHGTAMNSLWIWFTLVLLGSVLIGIIWDVIETVYKIKKPPQPTN